MDYLEQLVSEWYEYQGYFVQRNLWVGLEVDGSYECELNIVAYHPTKNRVVQIEPTADFLNWTKREEHFQVKFDAGRKYLHRMFAAEPTPAIEQIALMDIPGDLHQRIVAGGRIVLLSELLGSIIAKFRTFSMASYEVPEQWPLLKTLQYVAAYRDAIFAASPGGQKA